MFGKNSDELMDGFFGKDVAWKDIFDFPNAYALSIASRQWLKALPQQDILLQFLKQLPFSIHKSSNFILLFLVY